MTLWQDVDRMDAMSRSLCHIATTEDAGNRLDALCAARGLYASRSAAARAIEEGRVFVNGATVSKKHAVAAGDTIVYEVDDEPESVVVYGEPIDLDIRFEDEDMLVLSKQIGLVCHPSVDHAHGTLVNALTYHLKDLPLFQNGDMRAGLVHRIDKNTSGILVIAKNERAHARLAKQFYDHTIDRVYCALAWGNMESEEGTVTGNVGRSLKDRMKMAVFPDGTQGKHAVTHYKVLERLGYVNLLECRLETGRTHQIRVHMEYIGHPLFNDERYGGDRILKGTTFSKYKQFVENCFQQLPRHALHARSLGFVHPSTGKYIYFESDLPEDMRTVIDRWRNYVANRPAENENE